MRTLRQEQGFALVLTLVVTALLVAVAVEFIHGVYVDTSLQRNFVNLQQASLMADSGVKGGIALIRSLRQSGDNTALLQVLEIPQELEDEKGKVSVTIEEENGKLNLNAVSEFHDQARRRLLRLQGFPEGISDAVADWVDADQDPRPDGAETPYYQALSAPYLPRNGPMQTFGELGLVRGFTPAIVQKLSPYATVYGADWAIDINTAPLPVLMALHDDMTEELARAIIERRRQTPFASTGELATVPGMDRIANSPGMQLGVRGSTYRLVSRATVGEAVRIVEAVVGLEGMQPQYLYWREY
ncbi:General secretion pathway protein K [Geobacter metallireducens RCH3]|uniref:Type II secretion system minor pseudopilin GspK n=1 Tax=Geobacter metallireducens (strain ATCC 53774 / DSM 7210 / GS-15) TaxID=269799 RepID=Q39Q91_GEOMG|nr:type II secretion system minor pseudopilin GspK [Geobacter metallireducens]ABB33583.1 type II secretion system minor pseudopilin GspK [Geobacter metallireducens GS-15]EHP87693.1 General secretion pathway protein K [Geobacter metallireducens RCH3]